MNFLHLRVSEIQPGQTISRRLPAHPDTMDENNTPTALKGCGVKMDQSLWGISKEVAYFSCEITIVNKQHFMFCGLLNARWHTKKLEIGRPVDSRCE